MNDIDVKQKVHHEFHYQEILAKGPEGYDSFINPDSIWYWYHIYCMEHIKDFFQIIPKSRFLTVGDGYCGREASYIKKFGHLVHASDWEPCLLHLAYKMGLVDNFSKQDMMDLKFPDEHFDYVFTKESLHHLSKPYQGLYEMFRVAKKGVILIEPNGDNAGRYQYNNFEAVGNYMCSFTSHDLINMGICYGYKFFVVTYSIVFYLFRDENNINSGKLEEEKKRLIAYDEQLKSSDKPLLIIFFLKDREIYNLIQDKKYIKIEGPQP